MARFEVTVNAVVPGAPGAGCSVRRVVTAPDHSMAVRPLLAELVRPGMVGIWTVRRRGPLRLGHRRWTGRVDRAGGAGGDFSGVREPRRPLPSAPAGAAELDLPAA